MATISNTLRLIDRMSPTLRNANSALAHTQQAMASTSVSTIAMGAAMGMAFLSILEQIGQLLYAIPQIGDALVGVKARLDLVVREGESVVEINDKIFRSAQRARGSYIEMSQAVAKLSMLSGDAFGSTDEVIAFTELMQKSFAVSGSAKSEQQAGMYQLTQAMASGKLQGDEFRSIMENAPMLAQAIEKNMGLASGELKEVSSEGLITSKIIKDSLFGISDELNRKIENIPLTFSSSMTVLKNVFINMFGGMFESFSTGFGKMTTFILENLGMIMVGLAGIGTVILALVLPGLWGMATAAFAIAGAFIVANAPLLIVIGLVVGLISLFLKVPETLGVVVGAVKGLGAILQNFMIGIGNAITGIVNLAIDALNVLPGIDISPIAYTAYKSVSDAYTSGTGAGTDFATGINKSLDDFTARMTGMGTDFNTDFAGVDMGIGGGGGVEIPDIGKVGSVGKIDGDVEITSENLKYLKDLATQKFKLNYQQLTPQVTAYFGDVRESADVNVIMSELENILIGKLDGNLAGGAI